MLFFLPYTSQGALAARIIADLVNRSLLNLSLFADIPDSNDFTLSTK
jgi:hypothetical protein